MDLLRGSFWVVVLVFDAIEGFLAEESSEFEVIRGGSLDIIRDYCASLRSASDPWTEVILGVLTSPR